jgi:hypothetical protein
MYTPGLLGFTPLMNEVSKKAMSYILPAISYYKFIASFNSSSGIALTI